jgi:hypothetical protein
MQHDLGPRLEPLLPELQELLAVPRHPSIAPWTSFSITESGQFVLARPYYREKLEARFPPGTAPHARGPAGPELFAHLARLAEGIDHLQRVAPAADLRIDLENLFVDGDRVVLTDWSANRLTKAVESGYGGPRLIVFKPSDLLAGLVERVATREPQERGVVQPPASLFLVSCSALIEALR